jgi:BirA family transcriptional regulator, biotin operon repressor / biotin---[acetyl-CoA-carboxylase] ligase
MKVQKEWVIRARLSKILKTKKLGKHIYIFNELDSTQDYANSLPKSQSLHGTIVLAGKQNIGKGRMGRNWVSPEGGLWMSIILIPDFSLDNIIFTQFVAALAVADSIFEITKICCKLKWPNDVLINGKKVCGILIDVSVENETKKIVMGIGLNANIGSSYVNDYLTSHDLKATTLKEEYGNEVDLLFFVKSILERIEYYYDNFMSCGNTSEIIDRWKQKSDMFGKKATVHDGNQKFVGHIFDIDNTGALLLKLSDASIKKIIYYDNVTLH